MPVATMTSKGQVTVPKEVREALGLEAGTKLWFVRTPQGYVLKAAKNSVSALAGSLAHLGPRLSMEEEDEAVAAAVAEQDEELRRSWRA